MWRVANLLLQRCWCSVILQGFNYCMHETKLKKELVWMRIRDTAAFSELKLIWTDLKWKKQTKKKKQSCKEMNYFWTYEHCILLIGHVSGNNPDIVVSNNPKLKQSNQSIHNACGTYNCCILNNCSAFWTILCIFHRELAHFIQAEKSQAAAAAAAELLTRVKELRC